MSMEPNLSLTGNSTGSGWFDSAHHALMSSSKRRHKTADHLGTAHDEAPTPRLSKRDLKSQVKQTQHVLEDKACQPQVEWARDDNESPQSEWQEELSEDGPRQQPRRPNHQVFKRQKVDDLDEYLIPSEHDEVNLTTQSSFEPSISLISRNSSQSCRTVNFEGRSPNWMSQGPHQGIDKSWQESCSSAGSVPTSLHETSIHSSIISIAHSLCEAMKGKLVSQEVLSGRGGNDGLQFECWNKHQFIISLSTLYKLNNISIRDPSCYESWWLKWRNFLRKTEERAQDLGSTVTSSSLAQGFVAIKCENGHQFIVHYTKNHKKIWWEECRQQLLQSKVDEFKQRQEFEQARKQQEQKRLFEESYIQMQREQEEKARNFSSQQQAAQFEYTVQQICNYAKQKMERYMARDTFKGELTQTEIYNVYKIIYMPIEILVKTLSMIDRSQLSSSYRQLALVLHPDKNKHEHANDAFLKLHKAYELCKTLA